MVLKIPKISFILVLLVIFNSQIVAQTAFKSGGTFNSSFLLGNTTYAKKSQLLFSPADLTNEVSGQINKIYFRYGQGGVANNQTLTNFKIKLGHTEITEYVAPFLFISNLKTVLDSTSYTIPAGSSGSWFSLKLDSLFNYDANKTLVVELSFETSTIAIWGTFGTNNSPVKKLISPRLADTLGDPEATTWQDFGFDISTTDVDKKMYSDSDFELYPNPVSDFIHYGFGDSPTEELHKVLIFNIAGKKELQAVWNQENQLDVSQLRSGIYFIEFSQNGVPKRKRFIKK